MSLGNPMKRFFPILSIGLMLAGCSNAPRQVEASIPLVSSQELKVGTLIPSKYSDLLDSSNTTYLPNDDYQVVVDKPFTSSLGYECRPLQITDSAGNIQKRIACASEEQTQNLSRDWYLIPNIVHSPISIEL